MTELVLAVGVKPIMLSACLAKGRSHRIRFTLKVTSKCLSNNKLNLWRVFASCTAASSEARAGRVNHYAKPQGVIPLLTTSSKDLISCTHQVIKVATMKASRKIAIECNKSCLSMGHLSHVDEGRSVRILNMVTHLRTHLWVEHQQHDLSALTAHSPVIMHRPRLQ